MKQQRPQIPPAPNQPQLSRITLMLRRIQMSIPGERRQCPTYRDLAEYTGEVENTVKNWLNNYGRPTAEFTLSLLERCEEAKRKEILEMFCRTFPTLTHPRLGGDQTVLSHLKTLVMQTKGVTFIQGENDERRTFLISALAHSFLTLSASTTHVAGLDIHAADWFVPVPRVTYFANIFQSGHLGQIARQAWPKIRESKPPMAILNGIWSRVPEMQGQFLELATHSHVIIADAFERRPDQQTIQMPAPANLITVSADPRNSKSILVNILAL